jgi:hypothetical protein
MAAAAYSQRRVKRYRTHKIVSAPTIESMAIVQKNMAGYALPLSAFGYSWVVTQERVACNMKVSSVTNAGRAFRP